MVRDGMERKRVLMEQIKENRSAFHAIPVLVPRRQTAYTPGAILPVMTKTGAATALREDNNELNCCNYRRADLGNW